ncbi:MAG: zinc ribbon domain-containing protein [Anaerolineae bacterium]|nr:zinc ribbon domain-containing protein [Anaerolineae bacterium]
MVKRWLSSAVLFVMLGVLIITYIGITSDFAAKIYTPGQQQAFLVHQRLNLTQAAPVSNFYLGYVGGKLVNLESDQVDAPGVAAAMGATDCRVRATLAARYEEVEGVAATVYDLDFEGAYTLRYAGALPTTTLELIFPFPAGLDTLNEVYFLVDGEEPAGVQYSLDNITWWTEMASGDEREVVVRYRARGVGSFRYALEHSRRLENLDVEIAVQGLSGSEVPDGSLPTTAFEDAEDGEQFAREKFAWRYAALIADRDVLVELPARPGFAQRVEELQEPLHDLSLASPLLVACFAGCLAGVHYLTGVRLPLTHYLLAGLGFFLFYPALTFLSGVIELPLAAAVALVVVTGLLVVFLGYAAGWRRAWWQALLLSAVFLGLFSLGMMGQWRGLLLTAGGLLLVGTFMLLVARRRGANPRPHTSDLTEESEAGDESAVELEEAASPVRYCPHCGAELDETFAFCPACGRDARPFHCCPACGAEHYVSPEVELNHCPACGERMGE